MMETHWILGALLGVALGAGLAWALARGRGRAEAVRESEREYARGRAELLPELVAAQERHKAVQAQLAEQRQTAEALERTAAEWRDALDAARDENARLGERAARVEPLQARVDALTAETRGQQAELASLKATLAAEREQAAEKLALLMQAREQLNLEFKALANEILEDKSKRFAEQNQTSLEQLLTPLRTQLHEFKGKVEEVYVQEGKDRSALAEQVKHLMTLNKQLSQDAHNLTSALKGQSKAQGNWGEMILERVLEASGLRRGFEYDVQESHARDDGTRAQPDVVIHLPEDRHLVVDAKISLNAYEEYVNADPASPDALREAALKRHLDSLRAHVKGLSERQYEALYGLRSLDFVLMFVPVEPAFMLAVAHDASLWQDAWKKNVLLVSPSTLLFVVRTVAHLWRQEQQTRNAQEIARRGAELYDKLAGFVDDLKKVGDTLEQAQKAYGLAYGKFTGGRGNLIRQAEMLKELGVKPSKNLPPKVLEDALHGEDAEAPALPEAGQARLI